MNRIRRAAIAGGMATLLALAACAPGSPAPESPEPGATDAETSEVNTDVASMGDVTLTVWDQEVRGGQNAQLEALNAKFMETYPNITINRNSRSFDDLVMTLRLALSGDDAPDVVQANNTRSQMGEFVTAGQLVSLDPYMQAYGWDNRLPESVRSVVSYSPDGTTFGEGNLYGVPQVGEVVGVFANQAKMDELGISTPQTWADFEAALATAKEAGETPLMLGNLDQWPAVHVFGVVQGQYVDAEQIRALGFGNAGASWTTPENTQAAQKLVHWVDAGYFNDGINGTGYDPAWQSFADGQALFLIAGTWLQADLSAAMGDDLAFFLPPPAEGADTTYTTGASGQPFAITSAADNPDAAAAYIDFITNSDAMTVIAENEGLPVIDAADKTAPNALGQQIFDAYDEVSTANGLLPYLDWATPTFADTIGSGLQDLLAKQRTPEQVLEQFEQDYSDFTAQG
ncbi:MAG: extracellular solute-binding protein [Mobilicoccus sp.]|nr:extracellular solute-binding protein [Mobilicoccus sp.]